MSINGSEVLKARDPITSYEGHNGKEKSVSEINQECKLLVTLWHVDCYTDLRRGAIPKTRQNKTEVNQTKLNHAWHQVSDGHQLECFILLYSFHNSIQI